MQSFSRPMLSFSDNFTHIFFKQFGLFRIHCQSIIIMIDKSSFNAIDHQRESTQQYKSMQQSPQYIAQLLSNQLIGLQEDYMKLQRQLMQRSDQVFSIQNQIKQREEADRLVRQYFIEQKQLQSKYQDYSILNSKLEKQIKLLQEQVQIIRGKLVIEFNRVTEIQQQKECENKRKQILQKHLEQLKKGSENLRKKIKSIKQDQKKKVIGRNKIQQVDLQRDIRKLRGELDNSKRAVEQIINNRENYLSHEQYKQLLGDLEQLKKQNRKLDEQVKLNQRLKDENISLLQRIKFLEEVDIEFIDEKKNLLRQLKQKYHLLCNQKNNYEETLRKNEIELQQMMEKYPDGPILIKKPSKKKRQGRNKLNKNALVVQREAMNIKKQVEEKQYRYKGHKLKKIICWILGILLLFGFILNQTSKIFF